MLLKSFKGPTKRTHLEVIFMQNQAVNQGNHFFSFEDWKIQVLGGHMFFIGFV